MEKILPRRADYRLFREIPTRWADQDSFGHLNNAIYYTYYDTLVAGFLGGTGIIDATTSPLIGVVVETLCRFHAPAHFPEVLTAGLRVARIGRTSVRYEIGFFRPGVETACAEGHFIHVYVSRADQQQTIELPEALRAALAPLLVG
jgi:acyl-CoA thioester hydrolase